MIATQDDVDRWAKLVATAYASDCTPPLGPSDMLGLIGNLGGPLANCIMLAIPPKDWGPDFVNPALDRWEAATRRRRGRRLGAVNYALGSLTMD